MLLLLLLRPSNSKDELEPTDLDGESALLEKLLQSMERESLSEKTLDAVLRVYCTHVQPSFSAPWQRLQQMSSTSSGFVIRNRRIITNAHSVEYGECVPRPGWLHSYLVRQLQGVDFINHSPYLDESLSFPPSFRFYYPD